MEKSRNPITRAEFIGIINELHDLKNPECQGCEGSGECSQCNGSGKCPDCDGSGEE
jgi:hypothetical protein